MKPVIIKCFISVLCLTLAAESLIGQTNRLYLPFVDKESQSNVIVTICDLNKGQICPIEYTNVISNSNLFTLEEQNLIKEEFVKYKNVTTNLGPPGTVPVSLQKTNRIIKTISRTVNVEGWIACFQYTNSDTREEIAFGGGLFARVRNKSNDGYNVSFNRTGGGTLLSFAEVKQNLINGLFVRFDDNRPQGTAWDYRLANFDGSHLEEYRCYTNGMVVGKYFMWNPENNNLMLEAKFNEPYDLSKHTLQLQAR